jgi:hypothetical protein
VANVEECDEETTKMGRRRRLGITRNFATGAGGTDKYYYGQGETRTVRHWRIPCAVSSGRNCRRPAEEAEGKNYLLIGCPLMGDPICSIRCGENCRV